MKATRLQIPHTMIYRSGWPRAFQILIGGSSSRSDWHSRVRLWCDSDEFPNAVVAIDSHDLTQLAVAVNKERCPVGVLLDWVRDNGDPATATTYTDDPVGPRLWAEFLKVVEEVSVYLNSGGGQ